jgi:hypothetical protein
MSQSLTVYYFFHSHSNVQYNNSNHKKSEEKNYHNPSVKFCLFLKNGLVLGKEPEPLQNFYLEPEPRQLMRLATLV